jgi:hypothetical protein
MFVTKTGLTVFDGKTENRRAPQRPPVKKSRKNRTVYFYGTQVKNRKNSIFYRKCDKPAAGNAP